MEPQPHPLANFPKFAIAWNNFNLNNCCLYIDDEGKVIEEITNTMKKVAHVPVQTWKGWSPSDIFRDWFSTLGGFKILTGSMFLVLVACLILLCLMPLALQSFRTIMKATIKRKTATHVIML
jgi:hypothetical protein